MSKIISHVPQEAYTDSESKKGSGEALLDQLKQEHYDPQLNPDQDEIRKALEGMTGLWSDMFDSEEEAVEYVNEIRRTGGRPS
ncbi:MAG TPA: hypothetical protein VFC63_21415 [Blastocatellia bacterium]|nr:hypothetical protein [Blastocatellia bacterium]